MDKLRPAGWRPAFRAARVEQKIVKVPKDEVVVALGRSKATFAGNDLDTLYVTTGGGELYRAKTAGRQARRERST